MDAHNVSALCVESLFHTSEERTKEIDLGALADLPDTLAVIREMASVGADSMYQIRLLQQKVTDLEVALAATERWTEAPKGTAVSTNTDAPQPTAPASKAARLSAAASAAAAAAAHPAPS
jgi:hypothetical protein